MAYPGAQLLEIADGELRRVEYEDTEHFQVMRQFFLQREKMLCILLGGWAVRSQRRRSRCSE